MQFNYRKLLGRITEKTGTQAKFAQQIELSERSVSLKLNGKIAFKQDEIVRAAKVLEIPREEIGSYFFEQEVQSA